MPNKENNPNAQNQDPKLEKLRADRMAALRRGFERIKKGEHPGLAELGFLDTEATDLDKLSEEDLAKTKRLLGEIFGPDPEDSARGLLETQEVLDRFTYRRSKQNRPRKLVENVKLRLGMSPKFAGKELSPADYYPYVQAELLRQMARPDSELCYDDGKEKLEQISAQVAFPAPDPGRQIAAIRGRTNRGGRKNYQILQELKLPRVDPDELCTSLADKDEAVVNSLAQVYTHLFGNDERYRIDRFHFLTGQNGVRQVQTLDQVYDQQYQGPAKTPEAKLAFQKAMVVNALANGVNTEVAYEGRILSSGLRDACHGETSEEAMQVAAIRELTGSHNFSGSPVEGYNNVKLDYDIGQIGAAIGQMWQNIKDCDKWYIRSSERFINMKEHLEALNKLVNETWRQEIQAGRPITLEMMNELLEKADTLKGDIRHYLDAKQRDLTDDPSRRSDPESYEQRRIQANLKNLEALNAMTKTVESQVLKGISGKAREYFTKDLARLETRRKDLTAADAAEQAYNIQRSVDRQRQLSENAYTRGTFSERETLLQARDRLLRNVQRDYDAAYRARLDRIEDFREIVDDAALDQTQRSIPLSNAKIQEKRMHYFSKYAKLLPFDDTDRNVLENYRYQLLPTDKKTLQANSGKNATVLPDPLREGISLLEDLYGFQPHIEKKYLYDPMALSERDAKHLLTGRYISILTEEPVKHDFKAIYRGSDPAEAGDARLSEKDFAALAIAGARAPKSFAMSGKRATLLKELQEQKITQEEYNLGFFELNDGFSLEEQRLREASEYTFDKCTKPNVTDPFCKEYFPCVQNGRKLASKAMEAYEAGNLKPLAKLIAFGITDMISTCRPAKNMEYQGPAAELCKRMSNMLERDPELKKEAIKQGLDLQDLKMIDSMTMQSTLKQKADYGLRLWQKRKDLVTGDLKISIMADIYIFKLMIAEYENLEYNVLAKQPDYATAVADTERQYFEAPLNSRQQSALAVKRQYVRMVENMKRRYQDKFAEAIVKPGYYEKLKRSVMKMLKETELQNMNDGKYINALNTLCKIKADTGLTSAASYLKNYKQQEKNEDGLYKMKQFMEYRGKTYEEVKNAGKAKAAFEEAQAELQAGPGAHM